TDCEPRQLGYWEREQSQEMPRRGSASSVPLRPVSRPDFSPYGLLVGGVSEQWLPGDVFDLWKAYMGLPDDRRRHFFQAASPYRQSLLLGQDGQTLGYALAVLACEALKPPEKRYNEHNIYDVVEALLGKGCADALREHRLHPQGTRNAHFHRGEFKGREFA